MDLLKNTRSIKEEFEAEVTAALMIKCNALIPIKLAVRLCGISRNEIFRRMKMGLFPEPAPLSMRRPFDHAFYLKDLHEWIKDPRHYTVRGKK
ncbi:hypothetical protein NBRC116494_06800 [Aurantivibrio plasticivorans]